MKEKLKLESEELILRQFDHGQSNPTYYIKYAGKELVLRKKPPGKLLKGAHAVEREFKVMKFMSIMLSAKQEFLFQQCAVLLKTNQFSERLFTSWILLEEDFLKMQDFPACRKKRERNATKL